MDYLRFMDGQEKKVIIIIIGLMAAWGVVGAIAALSKYHYMEQLNWKIVLIAGPFMWLGGLVRLCCEGFMKVFEMLEDES